MGAPRSLRDLIDGAVRAARRGRPPQGAPVARARRPSAAEFEAYCRGAAPVILEGLADDWPARANWSLPRLRERFADREVSVIRTRDGRLQTDARTGVAFETMRFGDYLDVLDRGERPDTYLVVAGDGGLPDLQDDVRVPSYCRDADWRVTRFWLSAAGTSAPLHRDVAENLFFQVIGRKRFYLYPPAATPWLYSHPLASALPNYSRFDPEAPDFARFPLSREVWPVEVVLQPGDALYLPSRWWHQVRSLDQSASFNFWWANGALAALVRSAELVKKVRGLEVYSVESRLGGRRPAAR